MKKILFLSGAAMLMYLGSQVCGCGSCEAKAINTTSLSTVAKTKTVKLKITGMTCAGCSNHVTTTLQSIKGVTKVDLEYPGDVATVEFDTAKTTVEELITVVEKINYKAEIIKETTKKKS